MNLFALDLDVLGKLDLMLGHVFLINLSFIRGNCLLLDKSWFALRSLLLFRSKLSTFVP